MPLPDDPKAPWPPKPWQPFARDYQEAAAWYSGDQAKLISFYGDPAPQKTQGGTLLSRFSRFWERRSTDAHTPRQRIHVPAAGDVAATSADILFGDEPRFVIPEAHGDQATPAAKATEEALEQLAEDGDWASTLLEGAEICAGIGSVYLRPFWSHDLAEFPLLDVVHGDHAIPEHRVGRLTAVTFWAELATDDQVVWRHLERYEPGRILHGLYAGTRDALGIKRPLQEMPATARLVTAAEGKEPIVGPDGIVVLPAALDSRLIVAEIPNALPNRKHRGKPIGRADTAGSESLMDALDETYTAWMREIRLVKPRIVVPHEFLERGKGRGGGASFDMDAEVFSPLEMDPTSQDRAGVTVAEFELHTDEYARTCAEHFGRIVVAAGYSPATFGLGDVAARDQTATEVVAREGRTESTTRRKRRYWRRAEDVAETMLIIAREEFGARVEPMRPRLEFAERDEDPRKVAETIGLLRTAQAASTETLVRMAQPDLEGDELAAEVQKILDEQGFSEIPDPRGFPDEGQGQGGGEGGGR